MFNLFRKKEAAVKIIDKVVIDQTAKLNTLFKRWQEDKNIAFVFWFEESLQQAETYFASLTTEKISLLSYREATTPQVAGRTIVFAEHYPLPGKEQDLFQQMKLQQVTIYSSLREPLFQQFGGDKIVQVMLQLGMKEDEVVEHAMISKAIHRAQEEIAGRVQIEQSARSQQDWLQKNIIT